MPRDESKITVERCQDDSAAEALSVLGAETFTDTFGHLYTPDDLQTFVAEAHAVEGYKYLLSSDEYAVWLARTGEGETIGYAVAGPCHLPAPDKGVNAGELTRLYILNGWQGAGLGRRLLEHALDWLEHRYDEIYLSVYSENLGAQRLYARYGFEKVHEYDFMVGDHADPEFVYKRIRTIRP